MSPDIIIIIIIIIQSLQVSEGWSIKLLLTFMNMYCVGSSGVRGGADGSGTALHAGRSRVRSLMVSLEFFIDIILPAALWPWGRLSL